MTVMMTRIHSKAPAIVHRNNHKCICDVTLVNVDFPSEEMSCCSVVLKEVHVSIFSALRLHKVGNKYLT